jgi:hypothetical protein
MIIRFCDEALDPVRPTRSISCARRIQGERPRVPYWQNRELLPQPARSNCRRQEFQSLRPPHEQILIPVEDIIARIVGLIADDHNHGLRALEYDCIP